MVGHYSSQDFFLKNSDYTELARNIFEQTLPKLITKEGIFLRGIEPLPSVVYQVVVGNRIFYEVIW